MFASYISECYCMDFAEFHANLPLFKLPIISVRAVKILSKQHELERQSAHTDKSLKFVIRIRGANQYRKN